MNNDVIRYIIRFLLHDNAALADCVGYTADISQYGRFRVVITPSGFFDSERYGTQASLPTLPLSSMGKTPLLFGSAQTEWAGDTLVVCADIVAGSFFLLSRYEEWLADDAAFDCHKRFIGARSIAARAGFIHRPIVDEYAALLREWLRMVGLHVDDPQAGFAQITLTHDVDTLETFRHLRGVLGGIKRAILHGEPFVRPAVKAFLRLENDPAYTFPWLFEQNQRVAAARTVCFVKAVRRGATLDYPAYNPCGRDAKRFFELCAAHHVHLGLHTSYAAADSPQDIVAEQALLCQATGKHITDNRHHYLRMLPPNCPDRLTAAGLSDDFTIAYPDVAGFRLGTCRAVRWIDPATIRLADVLLHPLTVMESTLSNENYMNLSFADAWRYCCLLIEQVYQHHGELTLLWHNTSVAVRAAGYHRQLYEKIITLLADYSTSR
ncbi:MAG: polysaccharide deacetylase family protein [Prevotellaceae bacterium]|jgi:hypothetical protein|nr:polysaccharide deacetylase family protein [Prevotellaceae bacterium]